MSDTVTSTKGGFKRMATHRRFCPARRQTFLDTLAATCNITRAADHAGVSAATVYRARARDAAFAEQWREALAIGFERLEALVLEHCGAGEPYTPPEGIAEPPVPFDFDRAITVLRHAAVARNRMSSPGGRPATSATRDETNAALLKAIAAAGKRAAGNPV